MSIGMLNGIHESLVILQWKCRGVYNSIQRRNAKGHELKQLKLDMGAMLTERERESGRSVGSPGSRRSRRRGGARSEARRV